MLAYRRVISSWLVAACAVVVALVAVPAQAEAEPGTPYTWGANAFGQLGDGTLTSRSHAAAVPSMAGVTDLHSGREHAIVVTSSGTVRTWGSNAQGQLGLGGGPNRTTPADVPGLTGITAVSTGHYHSMALATDGRVWAWGLNASGQLGDGSRTTRTSPVLVSGIDDAVKISAGRDMSYAVRADGSVWAWGLNGDGQLGDGTTIDRTTPVQVSTLTGAVTVSGGRDHGLAVLQDGSVWAWGWNAYGQVGDGTLTDRLVPVQIISGGVVAVAGGAHHSYALRTDGTVASWGRNYRAELGDGTATDRTRPVRVLDVAGAVSLGSGRDHGVVVLADGAVKTWGSNSSGQLGDGTSLDRNRAVLVPGIAGASKVGGGGEGHTLVLVRDGASPDRPPVAAFTFACDGLVCNFDGSTSSDPDGAGIQHAWDLGDGSVASGAVVPHSYAAAGTYSVRLTVTDPGGASGVVTKQVSVPQPSASGVAYRAAASSNTSTTRPSVRVPSSVQPGDLLLLFASTNRNATMTTPTGWRLLGVRLDGTDLESWAFTRMAPTGAAGSSVSVSLDALSKVSLTLLAYSGAGPVQTYASAGESAVRAAHPAPAVAVGQPASWVVSSWVDRTSGHVGWTLPASVRRRNENASSGSARLTVVTGDTGPVATGTWPGATATSGVASGKAIGWSVVVAPE